MYTPGGGAGHCQCEEAQRLCGGAVSPPLGSPWRVAQSSAPLTGREALAIARSSPRKKVEKMPGEKAASRQIQRAWVIRHGRHSLDSLAQKWPVRHRKGRPVRILRACEDRGVAAGTWLTPVSKPCHRDATADRQDGSKPERRATTSTPRGPRRRRRRSDRPDQGRRQSPPVPHPRAS